MISHFLFFNLGFAGYHNKGSGTEMNLSNIFINKPQVESRSISAENPTGEKGMGGRADDHNTLHPPSARAARDLGPGWKISPCAYIPAGDTFALMDVNGSGIIRHIWITLDKRWYRDLILRIYWDGAETHPLNVQLAIFSVHHGTRGKTFSQSPLISTPAAG